MRRIEDPALKGLLEEIGWHFNIIEAGFKRLLASMKQRQLADMPMWLVDTGDRARLLSATRGSTWYSIQARLQDRLATLGLIMVVGADCEPLGRTETRLIVRLRTWQTWCELFSEISETR
jgi:hypothetical protein